MTHSVDEAELRALIRSGEARDIRERNDVPRSAVSSDLGVHWDTVRKWERGDRIPRGDTRTAIPPPTSPASQVRKQQGVKATYNTPRVRQPTRRLGVGSARIRQEWHMPDDADLRRAQAGLAEEAG